jgi:hypothetical protein
MLKSIGFNENQAIFNENRTGHSYLIPSLLAWVLHRQHLMLMIHPQSLFWINFLKTFWFMCPSPRSSMLTHAFFHWEQTGGATFFCEDRGASAAYEALLK